MPNVERRSLNDDLESTIDFSMYSKIEIHMKKRLGNVSGDNVVLIYTFNGVEQYAYSVLSIAQNNSLEKHYIRTIESVHPSIGLGVCKFVAKEVISLTHATNSINLKDLEILCYRKLEK